MDNRQTNYASSRLVRKERQKLLRQTGFLIIASVVILLGFIFVVIPGFIRIINAFLSDGTSFKPTDSIPPQVPILSAPVSATNSAQLTISGFGEPESTVTVLHNGNRTDELKVASSGEFALEVELLEGENTVATYAVDGAGNESEVGKSYYVLLDTESPSLEIETPSEGQSIQSRSNQDLTIKGKTEPKARIMINGRLVFPDPEGAFSHRFRLSEGENKILFVVTDQGGNVFELERKVTFSL